MAIKVFNFAGAKNQFVVRDTETGVEYFQSYDSTIVKKEKGKITLGRDWKRSKTTSKYRTMYLEETTKETQAKLDSGEYAYDETL